ncbi:hypothetical protein K8R30_01310 [archaeon]|nr:hypothetical protein [archaeon]
MNFKLTSLKMILSILVGFFITIALVLRTLFGGAGFTFAHLIFWVVVSTIIYVVWSLIQKKN